jgi:hypothetical protein
LYIDSQKFLFPDEPCDCSLDIETDTVVHRGVIFLPEIA